MTIRYRQCQVPELSPGMMLGIDVLSAGGRVMLSASSVLTAAMIERLAFAGCANVIIVENGDEHQPAAFRANGA